MMRKRCSNHCAKRSNREGWHPECPRLPAPSPFAEHGGEGVQPHFAVADPPRFFHDSADQPFPEAEPPHFRRNIEALHLTTAVRLDGPEANTTHRCAVGIAGKQQFTSRGSILTGHGLHLRLEALIGKVNIQRRRIGSEKLDRRGQVIGGSDTGNTKRGLLVHVIVGRSPRLATLVEPPAPFHAIITKASAWGGTGRRWPT